MFDVTRRREDSMVGKAITTLTIFNINLRYAILAAEPIYTPNDSQLHRYANNVQLQIVTSFFIPRSHHPILHFLHFLYTITLPKHNFVPRALPPLNRNPPLRNNTSRALRASSKLLRNAATFIAQRELVATDTDQRASARHLASSAATGCWCAWSRWCRADRC